MPDLLKLASLALLLVGCADDRGGAPASAPVDRGDGTLPTLEVRRLPPGETIALDGRLDEAAWRRAESTGGFVDPNTGHPVPGSPVNAAAWLAWDEQSLYVAARVQDRDPRSPFGPEDRDPHVWERSSAIELMLQPGDPGDNRHYYEVQVDVNRALWATRFDDYNRPRTKAPGGQTLYGHQDWDPEIHAGVDVDRQAGAYVIELALPWRAIEDARTPVPPRPGDTWRLNLYSFRDGQRQSLAWSPTLGQGNFHRASRFAKVTFR